MELTSAINHVGQTVSRPWGSYQTVALAENYQVKIITVTPGGKLSLQKHAKRAEHWTIVRGTARVTLGQEVRDYSVDESLYIAVGEVHRLENFTNEIVELIEVQIGTYLGEDDIVRLDDVYNRI